MEIELSALSAALDDLYQPGRFDDYAPNGLQVEGRPTVRRVATGVSANAALIAAAVEHGADAIVVHHGFFWRSEARTVVGVRAARLRALLTAEISLFAYHLPMDGHATLGNNACLATALGCDPVGSFPVGGGLDGVVATLRAPESAEAFTARVGDACGQTALLLPGGSGLVRRVGVCTGGAASSFEAAAKAGVDLYLTGEASEPSQGLARELGVHFVAAGHHATERFGPRALAGWLGGLGVAAEFIDVANPV